MWFLVVVQMAGQSPDVYPIAFFEDHETCMVVLREVEFGIQGTHEGLMCLQESKVES